MFPLLLCRASHKLIEDVVVSFGEWLEDYTRTLEQVRSYTCTNDLLFAVEENLPNHVSTRLIPVILVKHEIVYLDVFTES